MLANFNADEVRIVLIGSAEEPIEPQSGIDYIRLPANDPGLALFSAIFKKRETRCGVLGKAQKQLIFGAEAQNIASAAIIPLYHKRKLGLVVLGSKDETRFAQGKGVMFLNQLGEVLSRRVASLS